MCRDMGLVTQVFQEDSLAALTGHMAIGQLNLDLEYEEDSRAEVDMNFILTGNGLFIEVQGTAEEVPFSRDLFDKMTDLAIYGIMEITKKQIEILGKLT